MARQRTAEKSSSGGISGDLDRIDPSLLGREEETVSSSLDRIDPSLLGTQTDQEPSGTTITTSRMNRSVSMSLPPDEMDTIEEGESVGLMGNLGRELAHGFSSIGSMAGAGLQFIGRGDFKNPLLSRPTNFIREAGKSIEQFYQERGREVHEERDPDFAERVETKKFLVEDTPQRRKNMWDAGMDIALPGDRQAEPGQEWQLGEAWTDPAVMLAHVARSTFPTIVGLTTGYKYTTYLTRSLGLSPGLSGALGMGLGESQLYAASSAYEVYNAVSTADFDQLSQSPEFIELLGTVPGETDEERMNNARQELAGELAWKSAAKTGALVWAMHIPLGSYVGRLLGGGTGETIRRSVFKTTFMSSASEMPKSGAASYFFNMAAIRSYDPERDPMEGVKEDAVTGAMTVAPMGAATGVVMNVVGRRGSAETPTAEELQNLEVSKQNMQDALDDPNFFETWRTEASAASGREITREQFRAILEGEIERFDAAGKQLAQKNGITRRQDEGKAYRKFKPFWRRRAEKRRKAGEEARDKLTDAHQRTEGDMGLMSDHIIAQYDLDLYNMLRRQEESYYERSEREAAEKEAQEEKTLKKAEGILNRRGQSLRPKPKDLEIITSEETRQEVGATLAKISPKMPVPEAAPEAPVAVEADAIEPAPEAPITPETSEPAAEAQEAASEAPVTPETMETATAAPEVAQEASTTDVMTKEGKPFKSQRGAKAVRTRHKMQETHDIVEVEGGYALRPVEQAETPESAQPAEVVDDTGIFEDLEMLLAEREKIESGDSDVSPADIDPVLDRIQDEIIKYMENLDPSLRSAFVDNNFRLNDVENDQLTAILDKEAAEGISSADNNIKNELISKMIGRPTKAGKAIEAEGTEMTLESEESTGRFPSYFQQDAESVMTLTQAFNTKTEKQIYGNPDTKFGYLLNKINAWIHGIEETNIGAVRQELQTMRDEVARNYDYLGNEAGVIYFMEALDGALELADRAAEIKSGGSNPTTLRMTFGLDLFYPAVKDIIAKIKGIRGPMPAKDALHKLKKTPGVKAADLAFTGLDSYLNKAAAENRKVTVEELLEAADIFPDVEVTIKATDMIPEVSELYKDMIEARRGIESLQDLMDAEAIRAPSHITEFIRLEADRVSRDMETSEVINRAILHPGVLKELVESYLSGTIELRSVVDRLGDFDTSHKIRRGEPGYEAASYFRNRSSEYEYEEILIRVPGYSPGVGDIQHGGFGQGVSFFARVSRSKDKMVIEEIQSELASMGAKMKGKPHPFSTDGWPNLIAGIIAKRAQELGYKEVYLPTPQWLNKRPGGAPPKSAFSAYEKIFPAAMERLGAKKLSDTNIEEANLRQSNDMAAQAIGRFGEAMEAAEDLGMTLAEVDNRVPELKVKDFSNLKRLLHDLVEPPSHLSTFEGRGEATALRQDIMGARNWSYLALAMHEGEGFFALGSGLNPIINEMNELGRYIMKLDMALLDLDVDIDVINDIISHIDRTLTPPIPFADARLDIWNQADQIIKRHTASTDEVFWQRFQLPDDEIQPKSLSTTLNMGIDPTNVYRMAKRAAGRLFNKKNAIDPKAKGKEVADTYAKARRSLDRPLKDQGVAMKRMSEEMFWDTAAPMKNMLSKEFGEQAALEVINRSILASGHDVRASHFLDRAMKSIYGRLSTKKKKILDEVIFSSRIIQIARYRGHLKDFGKTTPQGHRNFLNNIEEIHGLSEREALDLFRRAELYFDHTLELLDILHEDGGITTEEYNELKTFRWTRTEAMNKIDPVMPTGIDNLAQQARNKKPASVRESGIEELDIGSELELPNMNMDYVLADWTQRVMKRSALLKINESLWDLVNHQPMNDLVRPAKGTKKPDGWKPADILVRGDRRKIYVHPEFARYWQLGSRDISPRAANFFRTISLSFITRPMATGVKIGYVPFNIIRDITLQQGSANYMGKDGKWHPVWNTALPIGVAQQLWNIGKVIPSTLARGKKYQQFADAGGSMLFLTQQGRPFAKMKMTERFGRGPAARVARAQQKTDRVMDILGYLNTSSEIVTRLSLVEGALGKIAKREGVAKEEARNNKKMYEEAAAYARDYLDFAQGGSLVKTIDAFRPYTGATVQAGRSQLKAWKRMPRHSLLTYVQVMGIGAGLALARHGYMRTEDEEGNERPIEDDISARDLARHFVVLPAGPHYYYSDEYGHKFRPYIRTPVDGALIVPKILGELSAARMTGADIRGDVLREGLKAVVEGYGMPAGGTGVPAVDAYYMMAHDLDTYLGGDIWKYEDYIEAEKRITKDTPQFFVDSAEWMNKLPGVSISPHNYYRAVSSVGAGGTWFTDLMGRAYDHHKDLPGPYRETALFMAMAEHPTSGRLLNFTRPDQRRYELIEEWQTEVVTEMAEPRLNVLSKSMELREIMGEDLKMTSEAARKYREISNYIEKSARDTDHKDNLYDILRFYSETPSSPRFTIYMGMEGKRPEVRARMLKRLLSHSSPREQERIWSEIGMLPHMNTKAVWDEFGRLTGQETSR